MTGALIDLVIGTVVFTACMLAWWRERQREIVTVVWIDDEMLARLQQSMKRAEDVMRNFGEASRKAAKAFEKFTEAMADIAERERAMYPLRWTTIEIAPEVADDR